MGYYERVTTKPRREGGIVVGSLGHQILLALRAPGGMTSDQIYDRFDHPSTAMCLLRRSGLIETPANGHKGEAVLLTAASARWSNLAPRFPAASL